MIKRIDRLTAEHRARMPEWRDKWIAIGLLTAAMDHSDRQEVEHAIRSMYRGAKLAEPKRIIFVPSPFVLRVASGIAAGVIHALRNGWPVSLRHGAVSDAVDGAVGGAVRGAVRGAVGGAVRGAVGGAVRGAVGDAVDGAVRGAVRDAVGGAVGGAVDGAVRDAVSGAVRGAVRGAVDGAVRGAVDGAVRDAVRGAVRGAVGDAVRVAVRVAVDGAVDGAVSGAVRDAVDDAVGDAVDGAVRDAVDGAVRDAVGDAVGGAVRYLLQCAASAYRLDANYFWWRYGWSAWASYFRDVCALELAEWDAFAWLETVDARAGNYSLHADFAMVSDRPRILRRDAGGRLHGDDGPAIAWRDGWQLFFWHGLRVPRSHEWLIADRNKITPDTIDREPNAEIRRIALEIFGFERYLAARKATVIAEDDLHGERRRLLEVTVRDERLRVIEVINGSLEPDGTKRKFHLGAARRGRRLPQTAAEAVANSYGIHPNHYREAVRT